MSLYLEQRQGQHWALEVDQTGYGVDSGWAEGEREGEGADKRKSLALRPPSEHLRRVSPAPPSHQQFPTVPELEEPSTPGQGEEEVFLQPGTPCKRYQTHQHALIASKLTHLLWVGLCMKFS